MLPRERICKFGRIPLTNRIIRIAVGRCIRSEPWRFPTIVRFGGSGHPKPGDRNGGLLLGIVPVGDDNADVYESKNNNIFLMNFCNKDQASSDGSAHGFCEQLCEDAGT